VTAGSFKRPEKDGNNEGNVFESHSCVWIHLDVSLIEFRFVSIMLGREPVGVSSFDHKENFLCSVFSCAICETRNGIVDAFLIVIRLDDQLISAETLHYGISVPQLSAMTMGFDGDYSHNPKKITRDKLIRGMKETLDTPLPIRRMKETIDILVRREDG
jgi:hypothetical protein